LLHKIDDLRIDLKADIAALDRRPMRRVTDGRAVGDCCEVLDPDVLDSFSRVGRTPTTFT
jgi:hypothetical protein